MLGCLKIVFGPSKNAVLRLKSALFEVHDFEPHMSGSQNCSKSLSFGRTVLLLKILHHRVSQKKQFK